MLNEIAKRLKVRTTTDIGWLLTQAQNNPGTPSTRIDGVRHEYRDVSDDVKRMFVSLLEHKSGEFSFGYENPNLKYHHNKQWRPILARGANYELKEVFKQLPPLQEGEEYAFPCDTIFYLPINKSESSKFTSLWVKAAIKKSKNQ